jgi:hypothetical protein
MITGHHAVGCALRTVVTVLPEMLEILGRTGKRILVSMAYGRGGVGVDELRLVSGMTVSL